MKVLVVRDAFGDHAVGDMIRDPAAIQAVLEAGQGHFCTRTEVEDGFFAEEPQPAAKPKASEPAPPAAPAAPVTDPAA